MARNLEFPHDVGGIAEVARDSGAKEGDVFMDEKIPELSTLIDDVKRQRDEIRVRLHLAKAEAKEEWARLETKWEHVRGKMEVVGREAGKAAEDVGTALRLVVGELKHGYERVRQLL
jgi:hypothetical protein